MDTEPPIVQPLTTALTDAWQRTGLSQTLKLPPDLDRILPILSQAQRLRSIGWLGTRSDNPRLRSIAVDGIPKILEATREKANSIG